MIHPLSENPQAQSLASSGFLRGLFAFEVEGLRIARTSGRLVLRTAPDQVPCPSRASNTCRPPNQNNLQHGLDSCREPATETGAVRRERGWGGGRRCALKVQVSSQACTPSCVTYSLGVKVTALADKAIEAFRFFLRSAHVKQALGMHQHSSLLPKIWRHPSRTSTAVGQCSSCFFLLHHRRIGAS